MNNPVIDRMILAEALKRTLAHAGTARPAHPIRGAEHDAEAAFGPHYSPGEWFGELTGADRMRIVRAVAGLEARALATAYRGARGRIKHLQLTDAGRVAAVANDKTGAA